MNLKKFSLGQCVMTPGAIEAFDKTGEIPMHFLKRHLRGDWGDLDQEDKQRNDQALIDGSRLLSVYHLSYNTKIWIITEWDRSYTTILLPSEY